MIRWPMIGVLTLLQLLALPILAKSSTLKSPFTAELARGNKMTFPAGTTLNHNFGTGNEASISSATVISAMDSYVSWQLPSQQRLLLDCSAHRPSRIMPKSTVRVVRFYANREYAAGCTTADYITFKTPAASIKVLPLSDINLNASAGLQYAQMIADSYVVLKNQKVPLKLRSEISFHSNGSIDFFTPAPGASFVTPTSLGRLFFQQPESRQLYFRFFADGHIQKGILGQPLVVDSLELTPGTGISFAKEDPTSEHHLRAASLNKPMTIMTGDGYELLTQSLRFNAGLFLDGIVVTNGFNFKNPKTGKILYVPKNSQIYLDADRVIQEIRFPKSYS